METTNTDPVLPWTPPSGRSAQLQPAGKSWDVVRVPRHIGEQALELLGDDVGAVIENPFDRVLCWLIAPGVAAAWDMSALPSIQVWGATAYIEVPSIDCRRGPGGRWRVPPRDRHLTDPAPLFAALKIAASAALGPRKGAAR
ncbi:hypothetical protein SBI_05458 [Streptomyces bingchenggensis BCW-1]|uniref:Uncharacterized protein n=1 Tax=Streptomyces bingchenggensis (strain BCW-1) TaxID=749414 RepID=D7CAL1_STRBB|nr:hypothetical protein [Streptomyces bingchenggensis]ADI08578.1 hypothetical protein SBI_05458 [Streptomyces bingchenggensis BCW-1]